MCDRINYSSQKKFQAEILQLKFGPKSVKQISGIAKTVVAVYTKHKHTVILEYFNIKE